MAEVRKILEITSYPPPMGGWGMRVSFLRRLLEAEGHRCVVLNIGQSRKVPSIEYETVLGLADYLRKVWRFSRDGFVVHMHVNGGSWKGFVLAILAEAVNRLHGRRPFLTFHAGVEQPYFPRAKAPRLAPVYRLMFALPQRIICNSEAVKAKIQEFGVPASKIVPIPAFTLQYLEVQGTSLAPDLEAFYARHDAVLFCYANIRPEYAPEVLIEAFADLARRRPALGLVLCGVAAYADDELWRAVSGRIAHHGLAPRLHLVAELEHAQFLAALARAAVFVRTHVGDGVCSSVLEALALGVPVVAAENAARPDGVVTYAASSPEELAAAVTRVLDARDSIVARMPRPEVQDTLRDEASLLTA